MVLRCLLVALLVLAMARPFLPSESSIPWAIVLPSLLAAAVCAGLGAGFWDRSRIRWVMFWSAGVLLAVAVIATAMEYWSQSKLWSGGDDKDVVIIIDGSMSMTLRPGERTNFAEAVDEARTVIHHCRPGDAVGIILAGPVPHVASPGLTSDRMELSAVLDALKVTDGLMDPQAAMERALGLLAGGANPAKTIIIITDGQDIGWNMRDRHQWQKLAADLTGLTESQSLPAPPRIIHRMLPLPEKITNAALTDVSLSRKVIGTDRPVRINVKISNTGTGPVNPGRVALTVDEALIETLSFPQVLPGAARRVSFEHRFRRVGPHVVQVAIDRKDDMPGDNSAVRTVGVVDRLDVLIVEGAGALGVRAAGGRFIGKALAPRLGGVPEDRYLVRPRLVDAGDLANIADLRDYAVVVLADVAELPSSQARRLAAYVRYGGGLLIAPGHRAKPSFYNHWTTSAGALLPPAKLAKRLSVADRPARPALKTFSHPALEVLLDVADSDADLALVLSYWQLAVRADSDPPARSVAALDSGDPFLVAQKVGKGHVLQTALALDRQDSNFLSLRCFVPMVHELVYFLASPAVDEVNVPPGHPVMLRLRARAEAHSRGRQSKLVKVVTPSGRHKEAEVLADRAPLRLAFGETQEPGLYRFVLPEAMAAGIHTMPTHADSLPFVVVRSAAESRVEALSDADFQAAGQHVKLFRANSLHDLTDAVSGEVPGQELWRLLMLGALCVLLGEALFTRWAAGRRHVHPAEPVAFGTHAPDAKADTAEGPPE